LRAGFVVAAAFLGLAAVLLGVGLVLEYRGAEIRISNLPDGATVQVDEVDVGPGMEKDGAVTRLSLASGPHRITIVSPGKAPFGQAVIVDSGSATPPVITYTPLPAPAPAAAAEKDRRANPAGIAGNAPPGRESVGARGAEAGFVSLCTGSDLSAWETDVDWKKVGPETAATATEGEIRFHGNRYCHLVTRRAYRDFVLRLNYQFPPDVKSGDWSGIVLFSDTAPRFDDGHAIDVRVAQGQTGDIYSRGRFNLSGGGSGKGWVSTGRKNRGAERPAGEWNHVQIRCEGTSVTIGLNGVVVNEAQSPEPISAWIGLRNWGASIRYRDVRIKELGTSR
jgi:hypothetical protein